VSIKRNILVYAHWKGLAQPELMGSITAQQLKGQSVFGFEFSSSWLHRAHPTNLDSDLSFFKGMQYPIHKQLFGIFSDSMPDTWGRTLMRRRNALKSSDVAQPTPALSEIDFLLGVHDFCRQGGLRFKLSEDGPFLDNSDGLAAPPWISVRALQHSAAVFESKEDSDEARKWIEMLYAPGSSVGGARPKANILDESQQLWIAKFPSKNDFNDKGLWEYLSYQLALRAGIEMSPSKAQKIAGEYHTFFTKRFDRDFKERIHYASAMTMTGNDEALIRDKRPSYLDIVEFIQFSIHENAADLAHLWKRIIFNIAISNTDDHLRNHGFLLNADGWRLSPAFDINCSIDKNGLALNIDEHNNDLNLDLAMSVGEYFRLNLHQMRTMVDEVNTAVVQWQKMADQLRIPRAEQLIMAPAFRILK
jgi:serine/threonine-protein kinase HipA